MRKRRSIILLFVLLLLLIMGILVCSISMKMNLSFPDTTVIEYGDACKPAPVKAMLHAFYLPKKGIEVDTEVSVKHFPNGKTVGEFEVLYAAKFLFWKCETTQRISIRDTVAPEITLVPQPEAGTYMGQNYVESGYKATDNYDGLITNQVERIEDEGVVIYRVTDSSGNATEVRREINYVRPPKPEITLEGETEMTVTAGDGSSLPGYSAKDYLGIDLTDKVVVSGSVDWDRPGTYEIVYTVEDAVGTEETAMRTVIVKEKPTQKETTTTTEPVTQPPEPPKPIEGSHVVPESEAVSMSYFEDAIFLGNSRTQGLFLYTGIAKYSTTYSTIGQNVMTAFTAKKVTINGTDVTAMEALRYKSFTKVYLMYGINEVNWMASSVFIKNYGAIIDEIRKVNPNATIYIQEIFPVNSGSSVSDQATMNKKIREYNRLLYQLAEEKDVYFVAVAEAIATSDGKLPSAATSDGIHMNKEYCLKWLEYLKTHTVR